MTCCYGWRNINGVCQPICKRPCENGFCIGPDRCSCMEGYKGKDCSEEKLDCISLRCQFGCQIDRNHEVGCVCPPGLQLAPDYRTCKDINECDDPSHTCTEHQSCKNTFGSYTCVCKGGFILGTLQDTITCRDIDECLTGNHRCSPKASCVNTEGSYICQCEKGYAGDGFRCQKKNNRRSLATMYLQYKHFKHIRPVYHFNSSVRMAVNRV
ncbi:nephronectin isoform X4 [Danio rerio]